MQQIRNNLEGSASQIHVHVSIMLCLGGKDGRQVLAEMIIYSYRKTNMTSH